MYKYPIASKAGGYNLTNLHTESDHLAGFIGLGKSGTTVSYKFASEPSQTIKDEVDAIALAHDNSVPKLFKIYEYSPDNYVNPTNPPKGLDYKTGLTQRLHPDYEFIKGELQKTTYYADIVLDENGVKTYSTPILEVSFVWNRDANGFVYRRDSNISWYFVDETVSSDPAHIKYMEKFYTNEEAIKEGIRRRGNIIDSLKITVLGLLSSLLPAETDTSIILMGRDWLGDNKDVIFNYVDASDVDGLINEMENDKTYWMLLEIPNTGGTTVAQYLISEVTI